MRLTVFIPLLLVLVCGGNAWAERKPPLPQTGLKIAKAARSQVGVTTHYDPAYVALSYPGGDVPRTRGVCTDVVIRALRSLGIDLQSLIHEDMARAFRLYPSLWGHRGPDKNIDHRRVPNIARFMERKGKAVPLSSSPEGFHAGDFVVTRLDSGLIHIMVVSERKTRSGVPLVIHNVGAGTREEDALFAYKNEGLYRWFPIASPSQP